MRPRLVSSLLLGSLLSGTLPAEPPAGGDIIIRAERAEVRQQEGVAFYQGQASLSQGNRELRADEIRMTLANGAPVRVEATGNPATLAEGTDLSAQAQRMVYDLDSGTIWLFENARVENQGRVFEGAELEYHIDSRKVNARGGEDNGRIRLVLPAEPDASTTTPESSQQEKPVEHADRP